MPFNRAARSWVHRTAKNVDPTVPFGSTRSLTTNGTALFVICPFLTLEGESAQLEALTIGLYNRYPYTTSSIFNISGMSFARFQNRPYWRCLAARAWLATG